jgi:hypothetical protein
MLTTLETTWTPKGKGKGKSNPVNDRLISCTRCKWTSFIMSESSVAMKFDGMRISRPACFLRESPTTVQPHIWHSWLDFVHSARTESGMHGYLQSRQNRSCACGLSSASYPHWPPTTIKESFDQLVCLQDKHNRHRRYLAHQ